MGRRDLTRAIPPRQCWYPTILVPPVGAGAQAQGGVDRPYNSSLRPVDWTCRVQLDARRRTTTAITCNGIRTLSIRSRNRPPDPGYVSPTYAGPRPTSLACRARHTEFMTDFPPDESASFDVREPRRSSASTRPDARYADCTSTGHGKPQLQNSIRDPAGTGQAQAGSCTGWARAPDFNLGATNKHHALPGGVPVTLAGSLVPRMSISSTRRTGASSMRPSPRQ